ncbi:hypothetical protein M9458_004712, partial [Cirrhinus mrigala]
VNGVVLSYSASCRSELNLSQWSCGVINASRCFCILTVLTATNSAGTSPAAHIHIPARTCT